MNREIRLTFLSGPDDGKELFVKAPVVVGRLAESDVPIPYDYLASRRHARLFADGDRLHLEDLGSRNGTYLLTGEPIHSAVELADGQIFRVGGVWFRVRTAAV